MQLMTPSGITRFDWHDEKDLPQESPLSGSTSPAPVPAVPNDPPAADEPQAEAEAD
jgi:hypothetical protein